MTQLSFQVLGLQPLNPPGAAAGYFVDLFNRRLIRCSVFTKCMYCRVAGHLLLSLPVLT